MANQTANYFKLYDLEIFEGSLSTHVYPWHYHSCYTIVLVVNGAMKYVYREKELIVKSNQILVINPFTSHYNLPIENCEYKAVFLPVYCVSNEEYNHAIIQFENTMGSNEKLFNKLLLIIENIKTLTTRKECIAIEQATTRLLFQYFKYQTKTVSINKRIIPAIEFIKNNLDTKLTITAIAKTCHLSRFHFQRLFKENTGLTVHEYIQQQRTAFAKSLLQKGNKITDTCFETGYFDPSHFNKAFKKMWVAKPSQF